MASADVGRVLLLVAVVAAGTLGVVASAGAAAVPADPANDTVGWEDGRWHNETIPLDQSDGLNRTERRAFLARSLARIEFLTDREVRVDTNLTIRPASRYPFCGDGPNATVRAMRNARWEAAFVVGQRRDVTDLRGCDPPLAYHGGPERGGVVVLPEDPDTFRLDGRVLVHELVHAVQPEPISPFDRPTTDGLQARDAVVEGHANYVTQQYARRCGDEWVCERHPGSAESAVGPRGRAFRLAGMFGYGYGPAYVARLTDREGAAAVRDRFGAPPSTTEQVIHDTDEAPVAVRVEATPRGGWRRVGADRLGEASVYATFWYASRAHGAGVVDPASVYGSPEARRFLGGNPLAAMDGPYARLNYSHPVSAGWGGDRFVAYANGNRSGYVWATAWDSERDAREFRTAYLRVLRSLNATRSETGVWTVPDGPFADAFRVVRDGRRVVVVNGPSTRALAAVHPPAAPAGVTVTGTPTASPAAGTATRPTDGTGPTLPGVVAGGVVLAATVGTWRVRRA
ncbi:Hvo_1808 family surface protein [Halorarius halobius]|uniref:Hvo_1808 family surface protein n=1 Tax=Halorarius halobius TaxID=2962671 RepID=UPI0020CE0A38|nr:Hvo_1808 family surface protein [Halorarius halobius]